MSETGYQSLKPSHNVVSVPYSNAGGQQNFRIYVAVCIYSLKLHGLASASHYHNFIEGSESFCGLGYVVSGL